MKFNVKNLVMAGVFTALGILMPSLFHMIGIGAGQVFLPMHFPVLLCGLVCGWRYGGICGFLVPLLCSVLTGAPPIFPVALGMAFELCAYGLISGVMKEKFNVYVSLITAMVGGRLVYSIFAAIFTGAFASSDAVKGLAVSLFVTSMPGVMLQILILPSLTYALYKAKLADLPSDPLLAKAQK